MTFTDVSADAEFQPDHDTSLPSGGIAVADFDRNGYPDIFVTGYSLPNRLFFNQGNATFTEDPALNGQLSGSRCTAAAAADYDNDGWPDLYVGCHYAPNHLFRNDQGASFTDMTSPILAHAPDGPVAARTEAVAWGDINRDGRLDLYLGVYPSSSTPDTGNPDNLDRILLQNPDGTWTDVADGLDVDVLSRPVLAATFTDIDRDGDSDLIVINDKDSGNSIWRNDGSGCGGWCFTDVGPDSGADRPVHGMGIAVGDFDLDGLWDLYFSDHDEQILMRGQSQSPLAFTEYQDVAGVNHDAIGWSTIFADFDNDMYEDAYLAVSFGQPTVGNRHDQCFHNLGNATFESLTSSCGLALDLPTQAAARIDFDMDGRLDLALGHWNDSYRLYRNTTANAGNWLGINLTGGYGIPADATGTIITIETPGGATLQRELRAGESRGASHQPAVHFGLAGQTAAEVTIYWPDGLTQQLGPMTAGTYHAVAHPLVFMDGFD